jgi:hypothetical protein
LSRRARSAALVLAALFLAGHLPFLARTLEDIDSVNFALGVKRFDVAEHRPHPPGYPVFIALGKLSGRLLGDGPAAPARGLAVWGAVLGALSVFPLLGLFRGLEGNQRRSWMAALLTLTCPLFWFTALRPMSDTAGLAVALLAQALAVAALTRPSCLAAAALCSGLAIGVRSQAVWLTLPLLAVALLLSPAGGRGRLRAAAAFLAAVLAWGLPLVLSSGGPSRYATVLAAQGSEDLAGVDLLATRFSAPRLALSLADTLARPWNDAALAALVLVLAGAGATMMALRGRRGLALLAAGFLPYALFHLLFQESFTTRYALPLIPPLAYLAACGIDATARRGAPWLAAAVALTGLSLALPPSLLYARWGSPAAQALAAVRARAARRAEPPPVLAMHTAVALGLRGESLPSPRSPSEREWPEVVDYWTGGGPAPVWLLTSPQRGDLGFVDHASRRLLGSYRWPFDASSLLGGVRPSDVDFVEVRDPGWFVAEGWSLTRDLAGMATPLRRGLGRDPLVAFARRREEAVVLMIGGRHLGPRTDPRARFVVSLDGRDLDSWEVEPGLTLFLRHWSLPAGALASAPGRFARIQVRSEAADGSGRALETAVEQFDLQPASGLVFGLADGWHQEERNPRTGQRWRWTQGRAEVWVHAAGRDRSLRFRGDSPLKYFAAAPHVTVRAGGEALARLDPASDFEYTVHVPAASLERSSGMLTLETDRTFVPTRRGDTRVLGLRLFDVKVE